MSKNHPHDNIYSILGKLDALKPTPEEKRFALVKEIRESVEAKGSILSGVDAVQAKLARAFAESKTDENVVGDAYNKARAWNYDRLAKRSAQQGLNYSDGTGATDAWRAADAKSSARSQKANDIRKAVNDKNKWDNYFNSPESDVDKLPGMQGLSGKGIPQDYYPDAKNIEKNYKESAINEKAVSQAQQKFMGMVHATQKGEKAASPEVAKVAKSMGKKDARDFAATKHKGLPQHVAEEGDVCNECGLVETECSCDHTNEGEITRKPGVTRHTKTDYPGYPTDDTEDSLDALGGAGSGRRGRPRKAQTKNPRPIAGAEKKGRGRPAKVTPSATSSLADPFGRVTGTVPKGKKGTVHSMAEAMDLLGQQLGQLNEGRYLEDSNGESLNHILNRFRAEVKAFEKGADLDKDLYDTLYDYYVECGEMPYGVQKARDADPMQWVAERLDAELGDVAYGQDPANAEDYGIENEAGIPGNLPPEQVPGKEDLLKGKGRSYYEEEVTMEDELNELARLAGIHAEGNAFTGKLKDTAKGDKFDLDGKTFTDTSSLDEEPEMEGNAFGQAVRNAKADGVQPGEKVNVGGKEYPVKESFDQPSQPEFSLNTSIDSEGHKTVSVNAEGHQAEALLQMLKMAGLGSSDKAHELEAHPSIEVIGGDEGCEVDEVASQQDLDDIEAQDREHEIGNDYDEVDEADAPVDAPATQPVNAPDEQYSTMRGSTMGPGEGDAGEKAMNPDRPTFKNGDNALSNPPARGKDVLKAVAALESKLAAEYKSIKKVSK